MINKHSQELDLMVMVIEYKYKNKLIKPLPKLLIELIISDKTLYQELIKIQLEELLSYIINKSFTNEVTSEDDIKTIILDYLQERN